MSATEKPIEAETKSSSDEQAIPPTLSNSRLEEVAGLLSPSRQPKSGRLSRIRVIRSGRSKNGNYYADAVLEEAAPMFEGAKVFYNHRDPEERDFRDLAGELRNARKNSDGIIAEFEPLSSDTWLMELLASRPHLVQFSIFVEATCTRTEQGIDVQKITNVVSVDIVTRAAAGGEVLEVLESEQNNVESEDQVVKDQPSADLTEALEASTTEVTRLAAEVASLSEAVKAATEERDALQKELSELKAEAEKLAREKVIEDFVTSKKGTLPTSAEKLFRRDLCALSEPTIDTMEAVYAELKAVVECIASELTPPAPVEKTEEEAPEIGLPPRAPLAEVKKEAVDTESKVSGRSVLLATLFE